MSAKPAIPVTHPPSTALEPGNSLLRDALRRLRRNRMAMLGGWIATTLALACFIGPLVIARVWGYDYEAQNLDYGAAPPSLAHWFGTDFFGRDLLTRVLCGGQISLLVGVLAATVAAGVGTVYGAVSGYVGGRLDGLMMRIVDVIYALPYMFVVVLLVTLFEQSLAMLFVGLGLVGWLTTARIVRGQVLSLKQREFVLAARSLGTGWIGIIARHLIPNTLGPIIVYFTLTVPSMILQEAFLSQLFFPGLTMAVLLFSLNFLGDGLRDALDPQQKERA
jgi:oligopeptide transport system permease protein